MDAVLRAESAIGRMAEGWAQADAEAATEAEAEASTGPGGWPSESTLWAAKLRAQADKSSAYAATVRRLVGSDAIDAEWTATVAQGQVDAARAWRAS